MYRKYTNGTIIRMHVDPARSHVISAIINIDQQLDTDVSWKNYTPHLLIFRNIFDCIHPFFVLILTELEIFNSHVKYWRQPPIPIWYLLLFYSTVCSSLQSAVCCLYSLHSKTVFRFNFTCTYTHFSVRDFFMTFVLFLLPVLLPFDPHFLIHHLFI